MVNLDTIWKDIPAADAIELVAGGFTRRGLMAQSVPKISVGGLMTGAEK